MATPTKIDQSNPSGRELIDAARKIAEGIATLQRHREPLGNLISSGGAAEIETVYGVETGQGQALFDRLEAFLTFHSTPYVDPGTDPEGNELFGYSSKLRDLVYGIFPKVGQ